MDSDVLDYLAKTYGSPISREDSGASSRRRKDPSKPSSKFSTSSTKKFIVPASTSLLQRIPQVGEAVVRKSPSSPHDDDEDEQPKPILIGQSVVPPLQRPDTNEVEDEWQPRSSSPPHNFWMLVPTHATAFSPPLITVDGSVTVIGYLGE